MCYSLFRIEAFRIELYVWICVGKGPYVAATLQPTVGKGVVSQ